MNGNKHQLARDNIDGYSYKMRKSPNCQEGNVVRLDLIIITCI